MTLELLEAELAAREQDVLFSRERVRIAEQALAVDVRRLEQIQAAIEHEKLHGRDP